VICVYRGGYKNPAIAELVGYGAFFGSGDARPPSGAEEWRWESEDLCHGDALRCGAC
jgi:hypothetical protein